MAHSPINETDNQVRQLKFASIVLCLTTIFGLSNVSICLGQVEKWIATAETESNDRFANLVKPASPLFDRSNSIDRINKWKSDNDLSGKDIYEKITTWSIYPKLNEGGRIFKFSVVLDDKTAPFLVYVPESYSHSRPSKTLIYYKGGWLNREKLPEGYEKEIVSDNPTFKYLDKNNIIEIFPALDSDLAIYGFCGYRHLRMMLSETKKRFNIDDNRVYLAGFSDGGRTVLTVAGLVPSEFSAFYSINGIVNQPNPYFQNYSARPQMSFVAMDDKIVHYQYPLSIAEEANKWGANWIVRLLKNKEHYYHSYEQDILPDLFQHLNSVSRDPFPNKVRFHIGYDHPEWTGVDWLSMRTMVKGRKAEKFHRRSDVEIAISDKQSSRFEYGADIAQVEGHYFNNTFEVKASLVDEIDIFISPLMVNLDFPVKVVINGNEVFNERVDYSKAFLIDSFEKRFDRKQVWVNKITLKVK